MQEARPSVKKLEGLSGWGRYPTADTAGIRPEKARDLAPVEGRCLARGLGRAYGDAALLSMGTMLLTERLNRFLDFDDQTGVLRAEAGTSLKDILDAMVPQGWFVPVTPGTKHCTLGGCIASDVHGKNHHRDGTFSAHVPRFSMVLADGTIVQASPIENPELFWATCGGMGLTGVVTEAELKLVPVETAYMKVWHVRSQNLDKTVALLTDPGYDAQYTVAWIDCLAGGSRLGRGIFMAGEHAKKSELSLRILNPLNPPAKGTKPFPVDLPGWALNPMSIKSFNWLYNWIQGSRKEFICSYDQFFYPLDGIHDWNRMYGKRGFLQYQFVLPMRTAFQGTKEILERLSKNRKASFLAVLKRFGPQGQGMLSFPMEGLTLALDIPFTEDLLPFLDGLDDIVMRHGGRIYLAKDARMKPEAFRAGYPRIDEFCDIRKRYDPEGKFDSNLASRLGLCR
ncbi:MAG: FAD-binding oxidoreductase [Armatimonadetes bacterium]|nr:FAD-binding oxidoreductase [Armatimonadota bacterium]